MTLARQHAPLPGGRLDVVGWLQPRAHASAARTVSVLCAVAVVVTLLALPLQPAGHDLDPVAMVVGGVILALVVLLSVLARRFHEANRLAWAVCPLLAVAAVTALDLLTEDASVSAQIFFLFPTLYGASQLRPAGAAVLTATSVLGELIVVGTQLPAREAVVDAGYVTAALVTTAALLTAATERHARLVTRLERMAAVDPLTGLVTRRVFEEAAASALSGAGSDAGTALLLLDVDHFKSINDQHGHPAGDQVLVRLAELLMARSRPSEVVCRLGGDEIAVLLPACSHDLAVERARSLLDDVRAQPFFLDDGTTVQVSLSLGIAHVPSHATDMRTLYKAADAALYEAKQAGRGRVAAATVPAGRAAPDDAG